MQRTMPRALVRALVAAVLLSAAAVLSGQALAQSENDRPRVLFIVESDSRLPLVKAFLAGVEDELGPEFMTRSEIYVEYLDLLRFNDPKELDLNRTFIVERYGNLALDAIGVLGNNALGFLLDNRDAIAPGAPIVYGGFGEAGLQTALSGRSPSDVSGVLSTFDVTSTLDLALQVQPDATEIIVIAGSANFDRQWRSSFSEAIGDSYAGLPVRFLPELSAETFLQEARNFNPKTIVVVLTVNLDAEGRRFLPLQFTEALAAASPAPVWTFYETQIGFGPVGGSVEDLAATGAEMGKMLKLAVAGEALPAPVNAVAVPTVDWREMTRHGLDLERLPDEARILFHQPTLWERYYPQILGVIALVALQSATIVGLLVQRRKYQSTQASLDLERRQLIHVSRNMRLGQLSASLAHEINQPLAAIQANAEAGKRLAARNPPDVEEIAEVFKDINTDVQRAGSTIANLRRLMVKGNVEMERVDLNDIIRSTLPLVQNELDANGSKVRLALSTDPVEVNGNSAQLQQIVLNLVLNASEAMSELPEDARIITVTSESPKQGKTRIVVEDSGPGISPADREAAFRPFVSTKESGLGVGLAICRSIAEAHGGVLVFADTVRTGARIVLTLPEARA